MCRFIKQIAIVNLTQKMNFRDKVRKVYTIFWFPSVVLPEHFW